MATGETKGTDGREEFAGRSRVTRKECRRKMIKEQIADRGILSPRLLAAFDRIPRENFVPERIAKLAYRDTSLPIGLGQTISQPQIVAMTLEALELKGSENALEVGTGTGYQAAVLSCLAERVTTIERLEPLAEKARVNLAELGIDNVEVVTGDGSVGWPAAAPYDAIAVAAAGPELPAALLDQLADGGRLVMPVGEPGYQLLTRVTREGDSFRREPLCPVRFVPLIGEQGWPVHGTSVA